MAGQKEISVGAKFTGDSKGFEKAAREVKGSATALKKDIKDTTGIVDELSGAIGGTVGEVGNLVKSLAVATGPIGALVAVVGALAAVWKNSQENIKLYLESADKLAAGAAGFELDAEKAREETRKRANGMIAEGYRIEKENMAKLTTYASLYTDEQKEHFAMLVREAQVMQENGRNLRDSVTGVQDKTDWQIRYNDLLQEQEKINDQSLANREKWKGLDAELTRNREIIANKESKQEDKAKAVVEAESIANQLVKEKNDFIDRQLINIKSISEMTATQELVEQNISDLLTEKNENLEKYHATMIKVDKMENKSAAEIEKQAAAEERKLKALKQVNQLNEATTKGLTISNAIKSLKGAGKTKTRGTLAGYGGTLPDPQDLTDSLGAAQMAVQSLENTFQNMFMSTGTGFKGMINMILGELKRLLAYMAARAGIFLLLQAISGGTSGLATGAGKLIKGGFKSFMGFAEGTNYAPGGLSLVGERGPELVNLPTGSRVTPMSKIGQSMKVEVIGKVRGRDLALILSRYQTELSNNT